MTEEHAKPASKTHLLSNMRAGRGEWDALIAGMQPEVLEQPVLAGGWSVKDLIAHVAAYEKWTAGQITAETEGRKPTARELYGVDEVPPPPEEWNVEWQNARIYEQYRDVPLPEIMELSERAFADLVSAIEAVPDNDLALPNAQEWTNGASMLELVPGQTYEHYAQHREDLRALSGETTY